MPEEKADSQTGTTQGEHVREDNWGGQACWCGEVSFLISEEFLVPIDSAVWAWISRAKEAEKTGNDGMDLRVFLMILFLFYWNLTVK